MSDYWSLRLLGCDGSEWDIEGPDAGAQGAFILPKAQQFYHSPAVTYWVQAGAGQKYQGFAYAPRKPLFHICTTSDDPEDWRDIWSRLSMAFGDPDDVFRLESTTADGVRYLQMRLRQHLAAFEAIEGLSGKDPHLFGCGSVGVDAQCEQPHWYSDPVQFSWSLPSGTSGATTTFQHPGNPGPVTIWPRWYLTAPGRWVIPDRSYGQEDKFGRHGYNDATNTYSVVALSSGEDLEIDSDPDEEFMVTIAGGLGPWMRSQGDVLTYPIPKFTPPHTVTVSVTSATAGATATIECDRYYDTPFGRSL